MRWVNLAAVVVLGGLVLGGPVFGDSNVTPATPFGKEVPVWDFFKSIAGKYEILTIAGVHDPKYTLGRVNVYEDDAEVVLDFPFCKPSKPCNLGAFLNLATPGDVRVFAQVLKNGNKLYTIQEKTSAGTTNLYEWELQPTKTVYRRLKFIYDDEPPFDLVYEIVKAKS